MTIKQEFITTLTKLKSLSTAFHSWFTASNTTDITYGGIAIPSRAKFLATVAKGDEGDRGDKGDTGAKGDKGDKGDTGATAPDAVNYLKKDFSNISSADFKAKATKARVGGLPTKIFTQVSGKFFVRNANGSLPAGIYANKVWSLAEQKIALGGTAPSGKNHIELSTGLIKCVLAGGGGSGGHAWRDNGNAGGNTTALGIIAYGGSGGNKGVTNLRGIALASGVLGSNTGYVESGGGSEGGMGGSHHAYSYFMSGHKGNNGGLVRSSRSLQAGHIFNFSIGAGGTGDYRSEGGSSSGADGYIEVEYVL